MWYTRYLVIFTLLIRNSTRYRYQILNKNLRIVVDPSPIRAHEFRAIAVARFFNVERRRRSTSYIERALQACGRVDPAESRIVLLASDPPRRALS